MNKFNFDDVEFEIAQSRKNMLEYFESMGLHPEVWTKARKKIMDTFSPNDGLTYRIGRIIGVETKGKERNGNV